MYPATPKKRALAGFAILAATVLSVTAPSAFADDASDKVVVTVDGKPITEGEMKLAEGEVGQDLAQLPPEVKRRALAEYLIDNRLFANAAEAAKLGETPEFKKYMAYLHERALREQYFEKTLKGGITEDEAKNIYKKRLTQMKPEPEFSARHILVATEEKAKELRAKIVAGEDFQKLAKENSIDPGSKGEGGFLGYFGVGQMVPEFENVVVKMQKGELSEPVKSAYGWHIIKLEDRRTKEPPSFEQVKDTIMNSLAVRKAQEASADMRGKAKVEYVDPDLKKLVEEQAKKQAEALEAAKKAAEQGGAAAPGAAPAAKP